ncbi:MAG TPA: tetratricopeptide repeat protein [Sphingomonas sp.]|nr:tetratricopeptide repeat protein [Sphingomonas sp.]
MSAGDDALAVRAGAVLAAAGEAPADLPLIALSSAARRGDGAAAEKAVASLDKTPLAVLIPSLRAWIAYARNDAPFPILDAVDATADPIAARFAAENRALLLIATGQVDAGVAAVGVMRGNGAPIDLRLAAAQILFAAGRDADARALLVGDDPVLVSLRAGAPAKPTLAFGVSRLLARIATDLTGPRAPSALAIALARGALRADPAHDRARLLLADALAREDAVDRSLATLDGVAESSPFATSAAALRVTILAGAGRTGEALALAKDRAERSGATYRDWQRYADRLVAAERPGDAAPWYRRVIDADGMADEWTAWLQYGGALDQAGDWPRARAALEKALALAPSEPLALNYLGYARAERGEDIAGATRLLERASALRPDDFSITDSLGWVYHLAGDTRRALPLLERASAGDPTNAEIADHLGDAYWTLGRRYEARYAWRAAALTAPADDAARIAGKIAGGLPPRR